MRGQNLGIWKRNLVCREVRKTGLEERQGLCGFGGKGIVVLPVIERKTPLRINDLNFHLHTAAFAKRGLALGYYYKK